MMNAERKFENRLFGIITLVMIGLLIFISSCKKSSTTTTDGTTTGSTGTGTLVGVQARLAVQVLHLVRQRAQKKLAQMPTTF